MYTHTYIHSYTYIRIYHPKPTPKLPQTLSKTTQDPPKPLPKPSKPLPKTAQDHPKTTPKHPKTPQPPKTSKTTSGNLFFWPSLAPLGPLLALC